MTQPKFELIEKYGRQLDQIHQQMKEDGLYGDSALEIYKLYKEGFPVQEYYEAGFSNMQLFRLYQAWKENLDFTRYADKKINEEKMLVLYRALRDGFDGPEFEELKKVRGHRQTEYALSRLRREREELLSKCEDTFDPNEPTQYAIYAFPDNGYNRDKENCKQLHKGKVYKVEHVEVGGFHSSIYLEGFSTAFNSVNFANYGDLLY